MKKGTAMSRVVAKQGASKAGPAHSFDKGTSKSGADTKKVSGSKK